MNNPTFSSKQFLSIGKDIDWFIELKKGLTLKSVRKSKQRMMHRNSPRWLRKHFIEVSHKVKDYFSLNDSLLFYSVSVQCPMK